MIVAPFSLLAPLTGIVRVSLCTKDDAVSSDADVARRLGCENLVTLRHVHGAAAIVTRAPERRKREADAAATDRPGLALVTRFADCQGFVVVDPAHTVVAVVHAGWRGMRRRVLTSTLDLLRREWGSEPKDLLVCAGPSLCADCAAFTDPLREAPELSAFFRGNAIDLRAAADHELLSLGVSPERLQRMPHCTRCTPDRYWTYRGGDRLAVEAGFCNALAVEMCE